jgi:hypothetical protein
LTLMPPRVRKGMLTAHVVASVGWLGAVGSFLALALAGLSETDNGMVRAAYAAMEFTGWYVIVPLSAASLFTGLAQSVGTSWGLFRHYWVVFKLVINVVASLLLLVHMQPVGRIAHAAAQRPVSLSDLHDLRVQVAFDAGAAIVALLIATVLAVYKPPGMTRYGWRKRYGLH